MGENLTGWNYCRWW